MIEPTPGRGADHLTESWHLEILDLPDLEHQGLVGAAQEREAAARIAIERDGAESLRDEGGANRRGAGREIGPGMRGECHDQVEHVGEITPENFFLYGGKANELPR